MTDQLLTVAAGLLCCVVIFIYWRHAAGAQRFLSAPNMFLILQIPFFFGSLAVADLNDPPDQAYIGSTLLGLAMFTAGAIIANTVHRYRPKKEICKFQRTPIIYDLYHPWISISVIVLGVICLVVGTIWSLEIGYNVFVNSLSEFLNVGAVDRMRYSELRTSISQEQYVASGYAVQFTAVMMPVIITLLYFRFRRKPGLMLGGGIALLLLSDLYFLTVQGARGWVLYAATFFTCLICVYGPMPAMWTSIRRTFRILLLSTVVFYGAATAFMGRVGGLEQAPVGSLSSRVASDFFERTVGANTRGHLEIMRILADRPIAAGAQWWDDLKSVRPGVKATSSGAEMYQLINSSRGSLGLMVWGSLLYNWGVLGAAVWSIGLGYLMQFWTIQYTRGTRHLSRVIILFASLFRLALFRDPYSLLLDGFFTVTVMYFFISLINKLWQERHFQRPLRGPLRNNITRSESGAVP
jgi:hypothetical protein